MSNASAPFKAKAPYHSRILGLDYQAFGLDFINPPFPDSFGCLAVTPTVDFNSSGNSGGPFSTPSVVYTLTNTGAVTLAWTAAVSQPWLSADVASGSLLPGDSINVTISLNGNANILPIAVSPYTGTITFTNTTNDCGDTVINVSLTVSGSLSLLTEYRTKGGISTLCGHSEYSATSTPPKKYRVQTIAGSVCSKDRLQADGRGCTGNCDNQSKRDYAGTCTYDGTTCAITNLQTLFIGTNPGNIPCDCTAFSALTPQTAPLCDGFAPAQVGSVSTPTLVSTQTLNTWTYDPAFCFDPGGGSVWRQANGTVTATLTIEDTETDANTRNQAANSFSSWLTASIKGDARSQYQARTVFTYTYFIAQYRLTLTGLTPSHLYNGSCVIYRRLQGSADPWVMVSTTVVSGTTDVSGNFTFSDFLPNARGYEYTIWDAVLTP